jgi:hypothetical protein
VQNSIASKLAMTAMVTISLHAVHFGAREDNGVPVLKALLKRRIDKSPNKALLGIIAAMSEAAKSAHQLAAVLGRDVDTVSAEIAGLVGEGLLEVTDDGALQYKHKFILEQAIAG